ncbi:membrane protein, partial [sediment metagenome]
MHITDGVLPLTTTLGGFAVAGAIAAVTLRRVRAEDLPKVAVVSSAFFVASLVQVPLGPTSVHLL